MKKTLLAQLTLTLATGILSSCSITPDPATPTATQSANSAPCEGCTPPPPIDGGEEPCVAPNSTIKSTIKAFVTKQCRLNGWTIVTTITPPDGITYGLGCNGVYVFSVDVSVGGHSTYASGTYNSGNGQFTFNL